ncbi:putative regulator of chromosome condensation 1/beta-lactamase-inhibitor protein II [Plasmopara halstedii]
MVKRLYVWGSGGSGQLGLHNNDDYALPQRWENNQIQLESIISGGCHSAGIDSNGHLFLWGSNDRGQLGQTLSKQKFSNFLQNSVAWIPRENKTKFVACGWRSTLAVASSNNEEDQVYSWGSNEYHQLGRVQNATEISAQICCLPLHFQVTSIACGWKHSLLATSDGVVFAWGSGRHGQLGLGTDIDETETPKHIQALTDIAITHVFCGWEHSVFSSSSGEIFTCGNNRHGQLGVTKKIDSRVSKGLRKQIISSPVRVADPQDKSRNLRAVHVGCGWHFVMCVAETGELVTWGKGSHGQLGLGTLENVCEPKVVPFSHPIRQITCGSEHSMVVTTCGDMYTCGWGEHGNLGHGDTINRALFKRVEFFSSINQEVISIAAGGAVSIAVTRTRRR